VLSVAFLVDALSHKHCIGIVLVIVVKEYRRPLVSRTLHRRTLRRTLHRPFSPPALRRPGGGIDIRVAIVYNVDIRGILFLAGIPLLGSNALLGCRANAAHCWRHVPRMHLRNDPEQGCIKKR